MNRSYRVLTTHSLGERYMIIDDPKNLIPTGNRNQPIQCTDKKMIYCHHCCIKLHYMSLPKHLKTNKHKSNESKNSNQTSLETSELDLNISNISNLSI